MLFLQADEDLLPSEMDEIWEAVLKSSDDSSRADIDSFVQIYRDIDDLFEDEDEDADVCGTFSLLLSRSVPLDEDHVHETQPADAAEACAWS